MKTEDTEDGESYIKQDRSFNNNNNTNNTRYFYRAPYVPTEGYRGTGEWWRIGQTVWWQLLNKNVLRCLLKLCSESHKMTSVGRLFQMTGAA